MTLQEAIEILTPDGETRRHYRRLLQREHSDAEIIRMALVKIGITPEQAELVTQREPVYNDLVALIRTSLADNRAYDLAQRLLREIRDMDVEASNVHGDG